MKLWKICFRFKVFIESKSLLFENNISGSLVEKVNARVSASGNAVFSGSTARVRKIQTFTETLRGDVTAAMKSDHRAICIDVFSTLIISLLHFLSSW